MDREEYFEYDVSSAKSVIPTISPTYTPNYSPTTQLTTNEFI